MSDIKNVVAIIGKAGSGKDTLLRNLVALDKIYHPIISCTTRPPRENEIHGIDYHFLTNEEFLYSAYNGDFMEYVEFNDWFYGSRYSDLILPKDGLNIGVFNPEGIELLQTYRDINLCTIMVDCSDKERLLRQLTREKDPDVHEIIRRFEADECDFRPARIDALVDLTIDNTSPYYTTKEGLLELH